MFRDSLKAYAPNADIKKTYAELETLWNNYQVLTSGKPSLDNARPVATLSDDVLRVANLATTQLESHLGSATSRLVNLAGRQRMLSQRIAKFYMLRIWGIKAPEMDRQAEQARREFISALETLSAAKENDTLINRELSLGRTQWMFFDEALKRQDDGRGKMMMEYARYVATTSESLLEIMDRVTGLYAALNIPPEADLRAQKR